MTRFGKRLWGGMALLCAPAALVAALSACSSSSSNNTSTAGVSASDAGADGTIPTGTGENFDAQFDGQTNLNLRWQVVEIAAVGYGFGADAVEEAGPGVTVPDASGVNPDYGDGGQRGVEGVTVCIYGDAGAGLPCATSDSTGTFTLSGLTPRTDTVITLTKSGYSSIVIPVFTASTDMDGTGEQPIFMTLVSDPPPPVPVAVDWTSTGQIAFFAIGPAPDGGNNFTGDQGAAMTLSPASGSGPYYLSNNGLFVPGATAIASQLGYFYNVTPGTYTLTITDTMHDCAPIDFPFGGWGFPDPPTSIQFPVIAGYQTGLVGFLCTPKSLIVEAGTGH